MGGVDRNIHRRIIPALAGNTSFELHFQFTTTDHPRSRGEYAATTINYLNGQGSSPLSRGIPPRGMVEVRDGRIIPALAGNTITLQPSAVRHRDHPRSRGEYGSSSLVSWMHSGSSPLSRGIRVRVLLQPIYHRIIPALAGNTTCPVRTFNDDQDHPRSRGEYHLFTLAASRTTGSSPLSRGILCADPGMRRSCGIIPALAGNTSGVATLFPRVPDHPRSRGEYFISRCNDHRERGSSPLSRGIL